MSTEPKPRAFWPAIASLLAVLSLLYVLSFGPVNWFLSRTPELAHVWTGADVFYAPILFGWRHSPDSISKPLEWYVSLGADAPLRLKRYSDGWVGVGH